MMIVGKAVLDALARYDQNDMKSYESKQCRP